MVNAGFLFRELAGGDDASCFRGHIAIYIAEGNDFDRGDLNEAEQIGLAVPARADDADALFHVAKIGGVVAAEGGISE